MHRKSLIVIVAFVGFSLTGNGGALAQTPATAAGQTSFDEDISLLRKDVRSLKKQIIAANMGLTDAEAQQFWPVYDRYTAELTAITDKKYALIKEYTLSYNNLTGDQAESYIKGRAAVDESIMRLRLKYLPVFRKILSAKATALYFQMDWRLGLIMDLQLASQTPLVEP
jgi:hypothetical protein